jgi:RNA polymerase sigma factor (sigma-70 family)
VEAALKKERERLLGFIRRRIGNASDAEDILQDVFYQLLVSDSVMEPIENLTAWLFTAARNKVIDWYRKRRPVRSPHAAGDHDASPDPEDILSGPADGPERAYWRSLFWSELAEALDELPEGQREVFVAHELDGLSFKAIAERTGVPINTLLSRKHYAVLFLRERLQELYDELERR